MVSIGRPQARSDCEPTASGRVVPEGVCGQRQGCGMYFSQRGAVYIRKQAGVLGGRVCPYVGALPRGGVTAAQTRARTKT